jgi:hypothetical protein
MHPKYSHWRPPFSKKPQLCVVGAVTTGIFLVACVAILLLLDATDSVSLSEDAVGYLAGGTVVSQASQLHDHAIPNTAPQTAVGAASRGEETTYRIQHSSQEVQPQKGRSVPAPPLATKGATTFEFPVALLCPPSDLASGAIRSPNVTFRRVTHPFHDGNRTEIGSPEYLVAEEVYHRTVDTNGSRCFGEFRGVDYNPGRLHDLAQLRGVTLGFCLQMCLQRNAMVLAGVSGIHPSGDGNAPHDAAGDEVVFGSVKEAPLVDLDTLRSVQYLLHHRGEGTARLCSGVAYYNWTGICWLKRRLGPDSPQNSETVRFSAQWSSSSTCRAKEKEDRLKDSSIVGLFVEEPLLTYASAGLPRHVGGDTNNHSRQMEAADGLEAWRRAQRDCNDCAHVIQKHVTDTNVYILGAHRVTLETAAGTVDALDEQRPPPVLVKKDGSCQGSAFSQHKDVTSILYAVLSEHQYVRPRMIPALRTWLRDEHVVILLVHSEKPGLHEESERLLAPLLAHRATPGTVRIVAYLRRDSLRDLKRPQHMKAADFEKIRQLSIKHDVADRTSLSVTAKNFRFPRVESQKARDQVESKLKALLERRSMIQRRQVDRGEFRLADDSGAWKDLPGIHFVFSRFRNYSFYMIIDDDAYIIQHNLRILLNTFYIRRADPWILPIYAGVLSVWYQPLGNSRASMTPFIQGGGGVLISHNAMTRLHPLITQCRFACDYLPHGDVRLGCCMKRVVGIEPTYETTFWHMHIYRSQGRDGRPWRSMFPVAFHRMKNESMLLPLDACVSDELARLKRAQLSPAAPVRWGSIEACYQWMRNTTQHEYKFHMEGLH